MKRSYRVLARLGEGGLATVYLAMVGRPEGFRKLVALKVLRDQPGMDARELRANFAREARVSARCHHRNVVQILDVCELDGTPALCMEFLDGQTYRQLDARATKVGGFPLAEQLRILAEAAHGLHHVHTLRDYEGRPLGLVHCDVSPENVFITYDGEVKLLDFGIVKVHGDPREPEVRGKLSYLAPELIRGELVDARADVFALGAMLWEAISDAPFAGGSKVDDQTKLRNRLMGAEGKLASTAPAALIEIVNRSIALDPNQRFPDAEQFAFALEAYLRVSGAQPSAQSLSRLISPMFAREAAKLRATIEPQLALSERWDREHDSPSAHSVPGYSLRPGSDQPSGQFDYELNEQLAFEPPPSRQTTSPMFASPADTVIPFSLRNLSLRDDRVKRFVPYAAVVVLGVVLGALLGLTAGSPELVAKPVIVDKDVPPPELPPDPPPVAAAAPAVCPPCETPPRIEPPAAEPAELTPRDLARERRHYERRVRRRAAQCAAGRAEKCAPITAPFPIEGD